MSSCEEYSIIYLSKKKTFVFNILTKLDKKENKNDLAQTIFALCSVFQGFRHDLGKSGKMINCVPLLSTFNVTQLSHYLKMAQVKKTILL